MDKDLFIVKIIDSLNKIYGNCIEENDTLKISNESVEVQIPLDQMYECYSGNYSELVKNYKKTIDDLLKEHEYKINHNMVFPLVKRGNLGLENQFLRKHLFEDIYMYFGQDMGQFFRFVGVGEANFHELYNCAMSNLNKLINPLVPISDTLPIYTLKFNSDIAPSMLFNSFVENWIMKNIGSTFVFSIPTSSTLLVAPYSQHYIEILREITITDEDPNKVANNPIVYKNGIYTYAK